MKKINFTKMVASGNDFIILTRRLPPAACRLPYLANKICDRKYGAGADGLLVLEKAKAADVKMRIFNADGSEAEMCGNGARCVAFYGTNNQGLGTKNRISIETKAGIIESRVNGANVKVKLTDPTGIRLDIPLKIAGRTLKVNFINTGVPHTVIFVEGLERIDVVNLGRQIRYHKKFAPGGTNVDFVGISDNNSIGVRTYERGVEDETLACGTGAAASALILATRYSLLTTRKVDVHTKSREILRVYFDKIENNFKNIWLEGKARIVCKGVYYV